MSWVQGARNAFQYWGPYLAARGVAMFTISYRLAKTGQKTFPHAVRDVLAAVQYVRGNAKEFRIAEDRIGLIGDKEEIEAAEKLLSASEPESNLTGVEWET